MIRTSNCSICKLCHVHCMGNWFYPLRNSCRLFWKDSLVLFTSYLVILIFIAVKSAFVTSVWQFIFLRAMIGLFLTGHGMPSFATWIRNGWDRKFRSLIGNILLGCWNNSLTYIDSPGVLHPRMEEANHNVLGTLHWFDSIILVKYIVILLSFMLFSTITANT